MSTPPDGEEHPPPFTYEELADLQAGSLTVEDERELRMRMEDHPAAARQMLAELAAVDELFPDPPGVDAPLDVPPAVVARWQLAIAKEADRRARSGGSDVADDTSDPVEDDDQESRGRDDSS